jgi:CubicO group peptidase (beta-lactamase class C family)
MRTVDHITNSASAWTISAALILALTSTSHAQTRPSAATIAAAVDTFVTQAMTTAVSPGIGVAIVMDGRTIYAKSHGYANISALVPANDQTLWYIASTTKSFTGLAIMLLAQRGEIDFDAPISKLLPQASWHAQVRPQQLTLTHFLSHTSGVSGGAVVENAAFTGNLPEKEWPRLLQYSAPLPTRDLIYSNLGYNIAGMVIDTEHPAGWRSFLQREIFEPLGMQNTFARVTGIEPRRIAKPHEITRDLQYVAQPFLKNDVTMHSAGGHLATVADLARWTIVNMQGGKFDGRQIFPSEVVERAHRQLAPHTRDQSKRFAFFDRAGWAAGWDVGSYEGEPMISRFGSYESTRSHLSFLPRRQVGVVAMSNGGAGTLLTDIVASYVYDLEAGRSDARRRADDRLRQALERLYQTPQRLAAQDSVRNARNQPLRYPAEAFTGRFTHPAYGQLRWFLRDGRLWYEYGAYSGPSDVFNAAENALRVEFGGSGIVVRFTFGADGRASEIDFGGSGPFTRIGN